MILLPIVDRELRVAARRRGIYLLRLFAALAVVSVSALIVLRPQPGLLAVQAGPQLFNSISVLAFGFSLISGVFVTADSVSEERREGTLGLLFLTDLRA